MKKSYENLKDLKFYKQNHLGSLSMQLASFLNKVFKKDGFILTDANSKDYIIGNPRTIL